jgi:hypothetical protein
MHCSYCFSDEFRTSRLRLSDVFQLLIFRVPVRCAHCDLRQFASLGVFLNHMKIRKDRRKAA